MREFLKYLFETTPKAILSIVVFSFTFFALGVGLHRILLEANHYIFYWKGFDPVGLFFGAFAFFVSIIITLTIQKNTDLQNKLQKEENRLKDEYNKLKQEEINSNNTYIKKKTDEIESNINTLLKQYQNIEVVTNFRDIMEQLDGLYSTTINAEKGHLEYNGSKSKIQMQLKIMNHSASFGRLLCSDVEVLKKEDSNFETIIKDKDKLKELIVKTRKKQKDVYNKMKEAFKEISETGNKYYITLSATKDINGSAASDIDNTAYSKKYLSKLNVDAETCLYTQFEEGKRFVQKVEGKFSEYLINEKQKKQIAELSAICQVFDAYSFNIPFQAFVTLPVDENILSEKFYRCIFFFINDNTIGKGLQLSAICTSNINFVRSISKALDAEKDTPLKIFKEDE